MMALIHSSRRLLVAVCAVGLAVSSAPACQTVPPPVPPGKLEAARLELERLKRDTLKVDKSIAVTKDLINRSKGERYLPDLYFRLSELYIEKSRLVYFRVLEEAGAEDKSAVVAPEARLLKDQAIAVYRRILSEFPDYIDNDKITFFIAHEYRELGNFPEMIKTYVELVKKFPRSNFRFESWLILGDYYFDKGDVDEAMSNYRSILKNQETYAHNMARYKLAWCYYNFSQRLSVYTTHTAAAVRRRAALRPDAHPLLAHPLLAHPLLAETLLPPRYVVDGSALAAFEER